MKNFYKLNLAKNPLQITELSKYNADNFWTIETDVRKILSKELSDVFDSIGIYPSLSVFFVIQSGQREPKHNLAHVDYERFKDGWRKIPFAINWELNTDILSKLSWYDVSNCTETAVEYTGNPLVDNTLNYLNGSFFKGDIKVIDEVECSYGNPLMVRTDIPHSVSSYKTSEDKRMCLSLRFNIEQINSWEQATNIFKDFIITDI
jgi:hypothetical protein